MRKHSYIRFQPSDGAVQNQGRAFAHHQAVHTGLGAIAAQWSARSSDTYRGTRGLRGQKNAGARAVLTNRSLRQSHVGMRLGRSAWMAGHRAGQAHNWGRSPASVSAFRTMTKPMRLLRTSK